MEHPVPRLRFSKSCLRMCLVLNSAFIWLQGASFLLLGVFIHDLMKHFFTDESGLKKGGGFPIAAIVLGVAMIALGFLIHYFILFSTKLRYFVLAFLLVILLTCEAIFFIAGFEYATTIEGMLLEGFEIAMINYADGFSINAELNLLQWMLRCCGAENFKDWYSTTWANGKMQVPESCCIDAKQCHNLEPVMVDDINQNGCNTRIVSAIQSQNIALIFAITCAVVTQILGIVLSVSLAIKEMETAVNPERLIQQQNRESLK